jgi:hypothetical protein
MAGSYGGKGEIKFYCLLKNFTPIIMILLDFGVGDVYLIVGDKAIATPYANSTRHQFDDTQ